MIDREQLWKALSDRAEENASVRKALEELSKIEELGGEHHEFDAAKLRLPYASAEECEAAIWK